MKKSKVPVTFPAWKVTVVPLVDDQIVAALDGSDENVANA